MLELTGDPVRPVKLKVGLLMPPGAGPFPLAIWNHGSDGVGSAQSMRGFDTAMAINYFLSRGYAVALPLMRGYGGSGGLLFSASCSLDAIGRDNAKDIGAVLDQLATEPKVDATRVVVAGVSFGGWNALATGTLGDARLAAVINFYGGFRTEFCRRSNEALRQGARSFGAASRTPSLWLYGENDRYFATSLWQAMYREYVGQGAKADLVNIGRWRSDSHQLLSVSDSMPVFAPKLDGFLSRLGLPAQVAYPQYVPLLPPPPTDYAAVDDVEAVPFLNDAARALYRAFLKLPLPRVFLIAPRRTVASQSGGFDPLAQGLAACRAAGAECRPYAFNDTVVWTYPTPSPAPTDFAPLKAAAALPYVDEAGREAYRRFLTFPRPRAFVIAPDGGWSVTAQDTDPVATALASCNSAGHANCRPYAVDGNVVWTGSTGPSAPAQPGRTGAAARP